MENEVDLRRYINVLIKHWKLIVSFAVAAALVSGLFSFLLLDPVYQANAGVIITAARLEMTLEPKYKTLLEGMETNDRALVALAKSNAVASQVINRLGESLEPRERWVDTLLENVQVRQEGSVIEISVKSDDPEKAAAIANAWGETYESFVNSLYSENPLSSAVVQIQADGAKKEYDQRQEALVKFANDNRIDEIQWQIAEREAIISSLVSGKLTAVTAALNKQTEANLQTLTDYYTARTRLRRLLTEAGSLQHRIELGSSSSSSAAANSLALLLLQTSAFTSSAELRVDLQMSVEQLTASSARREQQLNDLAALISTLETRLQQTNSEIDKKSSELLQSKGHDFVVPTLPEDTLLLQTINNFQQEVKRLKGQLEREKARKRELEAAMNLAWDTYNTLIRKGAEVSVMALTQVTVVRFAMPAIVPRSPIAPRKSTNIGIALVLGLIVGIFTAFGIEYFRSTEEKLKGKQDKDSAIP